MQGRNTHMGSAGKIDCFALYVNPAILSNLAIFVGKTLCDNSMLPFMVVSHRLLAFSGKEVIHERKHICNIPANVLLLFASVYYIDVSASQNPPLWHAQQSE